ncbi:MAG: HK97 family phage prohead protease [Deltaproteobacteria bacterium HGW-Deltaproteobacteria-23]|nr:MAG: HK97 family phage prohead protease [Deltaproteobacteria bacterium HGW-Deltaproteobacteria-23]
MDKYKTKAALAARPVIYKSLSVDSMKVDSESRTVSGYLSAFNVMDSDNDVLIKGCFAKSISDRGPESTTARKIAYLYMHDMRDPIGHFTVLKEDDFGLYFEAYIDKIPQGDRVLEQYKSGTLNQHSIGIRYVWDKCEWGEWVNNDGTKVEAFICYEVMLFEGSVVTLGANENTPFTGMKAETIESERNVLIRETERTLKSFDLETQYTIRQLISKHVALAESEPQLALKDEGKPHESSLLEKLGTIQFTN